MDMPLAMSEAREQEIETFTTLDLRSVVEITYGNGTVSNREVSNLDEFFERLRIHHYNESYPDEQVVKLTINGQEQSLSFLD